MSLSGGLRLGAFAVLDATADRNRTVARPGGRPCAQLAPARALGVWLSLSASSRAPNLFELFYTGDIGLFYQQATGDLGLQSSRMIELGSKRRTGQYTYQVSAFALWVDDLIEEQSATPSTNSAKPAMELVNVDQGRFWGGDLSLEHQLTTTVAHSHSLGVVMGEVQDGASITPSRRFSPLQGGIAWRSSGAKSGGVR